MTNVYSKCFYETASAPVASTVVGFPPAGTVWVVRDISAFSPGQFYEGGKQLDIVSSSGGIIWSLKPPTTTGFRYYQWQGREVLPTFTEILVEAYDPGWHLRINGYELTLP